jgi:repressor LexA
MKTMSPRLTPKQKEVLEFLLSFNAEHGYAPSQQEIAKKFGFKSLGTVQSYLVRLERQGVVRKTQGAHRGVEAVTPAGLATSKTDAPASVSQIQDAATVPPPLPVITRLPLLGKVAAGRPIEAILHDEFLDVPPSMLKPGSDHFVLKVSGNSMIEEGILDGDFVVLQKQRTARNGQTVVASVANEATIKKFFKRGDSIELRPANPAFEPLIIPSLTESTEFRVEGILVGVIRRLE